MTRFQIRFSFKGRQHVVRALAESGPALLVRFQWLCPSANRITIERTREE